MSLEGVKFFFVVMSEMASRTFRAGRGKVYVCGWCQEE